MGSKSNKNKIPSKNGAPKEVLRPIPELIITKDADPGCNNALYIVKIPREFIPVGMLLANTYEYRFIGIKKGYVK